MKTLRWILIIFFSVIIAGCGGSSGGGGGNNGGGDDTIPGNAVWNAGYGVIGESATKAFSNVSASIMNEPNVLKEMLAVEPIPAQPLNQYSVKNLNTAAATIWDQSLKYIYLDWAPLNEATYYQVYFLGSDGRQNDLVWDSRDAHTGDPQYATKAYLDLSDELKGKVISANSYQFRAIAYNSSKTKSYPVITVSLGVSLGGFPSCKSRSGNALSWTEVSGCGGYKVKIASDAAMKNEVWNSGSSLISGTGAGTGTISANFAPTNFSNGATYFWVVLAYKFDSENVTAEITYSTSSFTY